MSDTPATQDPQQAEQQQAEQQRRAQQIQDNLMHMLEAISPQMREIFGTLFGGGQAKGDEALAKDMTSYIIDEIYDGQITYTIDMDADGFVERGLEAFDQAVANGTIDAGLRDEFANVLRNSIDGLNINRGELDAFFEVNAAAIHMTYNTEGPGVSYSERVDINPSQVRYNPTSGDLAIADANGNLMFELGGGTELAGDIAILSIEVVPPPEGADDQNSTARASHEHVFTREDLSERLQGGFTIEKMAAEGGNQGYRITTRNGGQFLIDSNAVNQTTEAFRAQIRQPAPEPAPTPAAPEPQAQATAPSQPAAANGASEPGVVQPPYDVQPPLAPPLGPVQAEPAANEPAWLTPLAPYNIGGTP